MKYEIALISDIHFGRGNSDKLANELSIFKDYITENRMDAVIVAGDLYDRVLKMNEPASKHVISFVNWLVEYGNKNRSQIRILKGTKTHDHNQLNNFETLTKNSNFRIINYLQSEQILPFLDTLYIPEEYEGIEYYDQKFLFDHKYKLIVGHGTIDFASFVDNTESPIKDAPVFSRKQLDEISMVTIFGHIHNAISEGNCHYIGSYSRGNFIETSTKGFIHLTIYDNSYHIERIENTMADTYVTINIDELEGLSNEEKLVYIKKAKDEFDHVKVITKNKNSENIDLIRSATKGTDIKVEVKAKVETKKIDEKYEFVLDRTLPLDEVIKRFIKVKYEKDISTKLIDDVLNDNI